VAWLSNTTLTGATYTGTFGHSYAFYSIASDLVGNEEGPKKAPDTTTSVSETTTQFNDVPSTAAYYDAANLMFQTGVTEGCVQSTDPTTRLFCPNDNVTREQMAAFIVRAVTGTTTPTNYNPVPCFTDVPTTNPFFPHIQKMEELGITAGCGGGLFCPTETIPRWEMAMFMVRARLALYGATFATAAAPYFVDVPANVEGNGLPFPFIQRSYEEHITNGCGTNPLVYCPDELVTRGQMASFIMRGLFNETMALGPTDPLLTGVSPNTMDASVGSQITVMITGFSTNFQTGDTVTVPSGMLDVSNVVVNSETSITATLTANGTAVPGPQALMVTSSGQNLTLPLAIHVGTY
jgi:S-layer homology domain